MELRTRSHPTFSNTILLVWCDTTPTRQSMETLCSFTSTRQRPYVTMRAATRRTNGDLFVMVASQDQTEIKINDVPMATLNRGEVFEQSIDGPGSIAADKPILVAQKAKGGIFDAVQ